MIFWQAWFSDRKTEHVSLADFADHLEQVTQEFNHGKPPALPEDSQSLTVPGVCSGPSARFWVLTVRWRSGPFEGPAIVKPPAKPEDTY
jgi:hypothetical protein